MTVVRPIPVVRPRRPRLRPVRTRERSIGFGIVIFFGAHILLALLVHKFNAIATVHAFGTVAVGLWWALSKPRRIERVAYVGAYIMGAEVLWRMTQADIFWEMGKYSVAFLFIAAMLRNRTLKGPAIALAYFALLLPSILLTIQFTQPSTARGWISAALSGPFALMTCAWFFSHMKLAPSQLQRLLLFAIGPIIGIAFVALLGIVELADIRFTAQSNEATSGGFGPNQVSSALGLGVLLAFHFLVSGRAKLWLRALMLGAMVFLAAQSAMTFSRGGLYTAGAAILVSSLFMLKDRRSRVGVLVLATMIYFIGTYVVLPQLDAFTGGALSARFQDTSLTNREEIVSADLEIWKENPVLGVGPGVAKYARAQYLGGPASPHTEFSRLVAEHGVLGCAAVVLLLVMAAQNFFRTRTLKSKALVCSFLAWAFLFMIVYAMRLVAPAFMFGICFAAFLPQEQEARNPVRNQRRPGIPENRPINYQRAMFKRYRVDSPLPLREEVERLRGFSEPSRD